MTCLLAYSLCYGQDEFQERKSANSNLHTEFDSDDFIIPKADIALASAIGTNANLTLLLQKYITASETPIEYLDPAFEKYVDIRLLHVARKNMDCGMLTDVALQLAKGEEVLLRPHKLVSSDALLRLAVDWAEEKRDESILKRISLAAQHLGKKELTEYLSSQEKLAGESRSVSPELSIPLDSVTPEEYSEIRSLLISLNDARMLKDAATIDALKEKADTLKLPEQQRKYLELIFGSSRSSDNSEAKADQSTADILNILGADSRTDPDQGRQIAAGILMIIAGALNSQNGGVQPLNNFPQINNFPQNNNVQPPSNFPQDNSFPQNNNVQPPGNFPQENSFPPQNNFPQNNNFPMNNIPPGNGGGDLEQFLLAAPGSVAKSSSTAPKRYYDRNRKQWVIIR